MPDALWASDTPESRVVIPQRPEKVFTAKRRGENRNKRGRIRRPSSHSALEKRGLPSADLGGEKPLRPAQRISRASIAANAGSACT
ncbi:hypothetical protein D3C81_26150 [compost metagenome]